jgi:hypothetical protein
MERITTSLPSDVYAYISTSENHNILTIANFRGESKTVSFPVGDLSEGTKYLTNLIDFSVIDIQAISGILDIELESYEAKVFYLGDEPVGVDNEDFENIIIDEFKLNQNFPNPFNPSTKISFQLATNEFVTLRIYDVVGQEVKTLLNSEMQKGKYDIDFNASKLSSGIYFYRIQAGKFIDTKKLILMK